MTNVNQNSALDASTSGSHAVRPSDVTDLIRQGCRARGRHGFKVRSGELMGHIFFEHGQVVHAEFGEDCGLRAVVEMLRAGPVALEPWTSRWPIQRSLHLGAEVLLSMAEQDAARELARLDTSVMRKVRRPSNELASPPALALSSVASSLASRARKVDVGEAAESIELPPRGLSSRVAETLAQARRREPSVVAAAEARVGALRREDLARPSPVPAPSRAPRRPGLPGRVIRASRPQSRVIVVARRESGAAPPSEEPPSPSPEPEHEATGFETEPGAGSQPTTMVRMAERGSILAARGKNAGRLADAAAFIHGVANLIAADLGRYGRANVHLRGGGWSLLVVRSEVNDIAAALGPTRRLASLLRKNGL